VGPPNAISRGVKTEGKLGLIMSDTASPTDIASESQNSGPKDENLGLLDRFAPEVALYIHRIKILAACWLVPFEQLKVQTFTKDDGASARGFALIVIAALTFAVRSDEVSEQMRAAFAGGAAIALTFILSLISRAFRISIREQLIVSAYASTIVVMFLFVLCRRILIQYFPVLYGSFSDRGDILLCAITAGLAAFVLLLLKSKYWDRCQIGRRGIWHGVTLTGGSALILMLVAFMKHEWFSDLLHSMNFLSRFGGS
jgi:hypothetical protein